MINLLISPTSYKEQPTVTFPYRCGLGEQFGEFMSIFRRTTSVLTRKDVVGKHRKKKSSKLPSTLSAKRVTDSSWSWYFNGASRSADNRAAKLKFGSRFFSLSASNFHAMFQSHTYSDYVETVKSVYIFSAFNWKVDSDLRRFHVRIYENDNATKTPTRKPIMGADRIFPSWKTKRSRKLQPGWKEWWKRDSAILFLFFSRNLW